MAPPLEPGYARVEDIPDWAKESWRLLWRRPLAFLTVSLAFHGIASAASAIPVLSLFLPVLVCQAVTLILIRYAQAADQAKPVSLAALYATIRRLILGLLLFTLICVCIFVAAVLAAAFLTPEVPGGGTRAAQAFPLYRWVWPGTVSFLILYTGTILTFTWFLFPLLALHELSIGEARALARRAMRKNEKVVVIASVAPFLGLIILGLLTEASYLLSLLAVPLFAAYQYVSYRHVFLGRKENAPLPATVTRVADSANSP
jgi:hypothetical protein